MQRNANRLRGHSHHLGSLKIGFAKTLGAALLIISGLFSSLAANALSTTIVISQVYGGGGNTGSVYKNDFVELYNLSAAPVNVTGWSVQYASATGVFSSPITLTGTIPAGGYYLVQLAVGTGGTTNLPAPDATGTVAMSATGGKVALVNNAIALTGSAINPSPLTGTACPTPTTTIVDFVAYGTTPTCAETAATPPPSNTTSVIRKTAGSTETDNNSSDFVAGAPTPRNGSPIPDLTIATTAPTSASVSTNYTYTITITSAGANATGVTATFAIPAGTTYVSNGVGTTNFTGAQSAGTVTFSGGTVNTGIPAVLTVTVTAPAAATTITLAATSTKVDPLNAITESNETNNNDTASALASTNITTVALPDLTITRTGPTTAITNTTITYTLTISNGGTATATGVAADFTLPSNVTHSATNVGATGFATALISGVVKLTGGTVAVGTPAIITVDVTTPVAAATVTSAASTAIVDPSNAVAEFVETNNAATNVVTTAVSLPPTPDLVVTLAAPSTSAINANYEYTITVNNSGTSDATGVVARFTLPAGTSYMSANVGTTNFTAAQAAGIVTFSGGTVNTTSPQVLKVTVQAPTAPTTITTVVGAATVDPSNAIAELNETNNQSAVVSTVINGQVRISAVQGSGTASPLVGNTVLVQGIVTGVFQGTSTLAGFFLQEEDVNSDGNPATSEGIFVYTNLAPATVAVGDKVNVSGSVIEFGTAPNTLTEITSPTVTFISAGNTLPSAAAVTLPVAVIGDLERYEGMRVNFAQPLTLTDNNNLAQFGELTFSVNGRLLQPTSSIDPNDAIASGTTSTGTTNAAAITARNSLNSRSSIILDDGSTAQYPAIIPFMDAATKTIRVGSTITSFTGILSQSFGTHRLLAPTAPVINYAPRPLTPPAVGGNVKIAGANVLNYFNGDGAGNTFPTSRGANSAIEFARQRAKTIVALNALNADVVALLEIENEDNTATSSLVDLLAGLNNAAGAGTWAGVERPVGYGSIVGGTDVIRPAFIYKPAVVTPVGLSTALNNASFAQGRAPVAQVFKLVSNNEQFVVVANHFKSKSSSGATGLNVDQNDGQAAFNETRRQQATALLGFITTLTATTPRLITLGDFNAYEEEDPLDIFRVGGLTSAISNNYSYVFGGLTGSLDHAFVNAAMLPNITGSGKWHINADEPEAIDYNVEKKLNAGCGNALISSSEPCVGQDLFDATHPFRASDHDPIIVGLQLGINPSPSPVPVTVTISVEAGSTGFGSISPLGDNTVLTGQKLALNITANPRYLANLSGTCGTAVTSPPVALVPQGAGSFAAETSVVGGNCTVVARFTAVTPQLRLGASLTAAPISTASVVGQMARFTASLYGAVGASSSTFAFFADGYMIADCAAVSTTSTVNNDLSVRVATCETTGLAVGTRAITATYGGDIYNFPANADASASPNQTQSHVVTAADVTPPIGLTAQTISVAAITAKQFGASPFGVTATATSGLTVVLASTTPSVCTVSGATVAVAATSSAAATCTLTANQAGNATFAPAAQVSVSFSVMPAALTAQTITVAAIAATQFGAAPFAATTSATSGLIVVLASTTPNVCTVSGNTVIVAVAGTVSATCTLAANQVGNATFAPAAQVSVSFSVTATPILSDTTPDAFRFVSVTNQVIALPEIRSNAVTITGVDAAASISVSGGEYSIGCTASFTAATATINNNQTVCVRHAGAVAEGATVTTSLNVGGVTGAFSSTTAVVLAGGKRFPLYRLYSPNQARHFYTTNEAERMQLIADGWQPEGIVAQLLETPGTMGGVATQPLFRLFHAPSNYHFWTSDANENAVLATRGWVQQGTVGYLGAAPNPLGIKFIRLIRGNAVRHVFTTDQNEARFLVDVAKYIDEGVVGYALK